MNIDNFEQPIPIDPQMSRELHPSAGKSSIEVDDEMRFIRREALLAKRALNAGARFTPSTRQLIAERRAALLDQ